MLSGRLSAVAAAAAMLTLTACAGADGTEGGAIRENVIEPGITAIDESSAAACASESSSFRTALEAYELLEGDPAPDEQALIDRGLLRSESELWDIVDGQLVPQDPGCGDVPTTVPTADIVTDEGASGALTVEGVLATFTQDDVDAVGGAACARQLAVVIAGASQYTENEGVEPRTLAEVEAAGHLSEPVKLWEVVDEALRPTSGSPCVDFVDAEQAIARAQACRVEIRTLQTAREAYIAKFGSEPTRQDLVDSDMIIDRDADGEFLIDLVDGVTQPVPGGDCDGIDLSEVAAATSSSGADPCTSDRRTLEVAVEAYVIEAGVEPAREEDLVTAGILRSVSASHDLAADGAIVPAPGGGCE